MKKFWALLAALALVLTGSTASADPTLDFNMDAVHPAGASVSYAGGANPLVGANIGVDSVVGLTTPLNSGVVTAISGGVLSFTTGNFIGATVNTWGFAGGGSISIVGDIGGGSITLLTGTITGATVVDTGVGGLKVTIATFINTVDAGLAAFYGLPGGSFPWDGGLNLSFIANGAPPGAFSSSLVGSGDVLTRPVPEPTSLMLMGAGALGLGAFGLRRRLRAG